MIASMIDDQRTVAENKAVSDSTALYRYEIYRDQRYFHYTILPSLYLKV